ncbi:MAG: hypothetical protein GC137_02670 [Alphaproteobacteria bacterium]|nr:hypothetical protein [Alphaproteobacteria bacterium]
MLKELFDAIEREELLEAAREGVVVAQYTLGQYYLSGKGSFEQSDALGVLWLTRAHNNGCEDAEILLRWHKAGRNRALEI